MVPAGSLSSNPARPKSFGPCPGRNETTRPLNDFRCSVIVPVYNGEETIVRCLDALAVQDAGQDTYQVIVVDDGSTDATASIIRTWSTGHPELVLQLVQQENAGPAAARNHGTVVQDRPGALSSGHAYSKRDGGRRCRQQRQASGDGKHLD